MKRRFVVGGNWKMNGNFESINDLTSTLLQYPIPPDTGKIIGRLLLPDKTIIIVTNLQAVHSNLF